MARAVAGVLKKTIGWIDGRTITVQVWRMIEVVCGVVGDETGRVLACRRPAGGHLGGMWEFPGGKVEAGETPEAALVRELREELAVDVEVGEALVPVEWDYGRGPIRLIPFRCRIVRGELVLVEHTECRWCGPADAADLIWAPADLPVLWDVFGALW